MACESLRVEQVDATILDREYRQLIEQQLSVLMMEVPVPVSRLCEKMKPEIHLLLDSILWTSRIYRGASPGQVEMNISYKNYPLNKIFLHFVLSAVVPYVQSRLSASLDNLLIRRCLAKIAAIYEAMCILHYLNFLRVGGHSMLVESYLSLRNWNNSLPTVGTINYESQNRELLWHTFRDALLLLWPAYAVVYEKWVQSRRRGEVQSYEVALSCGRCGRVAVIPMRTAGCGHIACYWCVASRGPTESAQCTVCGGEERHVTPVRGRALT
ncbi:Pex2 / Pex12 amino terminal region [Ancylostoma duodenale]|uniref:RING-type E3 ubiquitin transferase (cysteine targeting) n=1 Tax=Ancylostoma duodenale TaxID=51022 RepID=A0A0C2GPX4_9BILA|nr:Pex2 / Pex12 amino terminal region [Ancylostoma duodenale]